MSHHDERAGGVFEAGGFELVGMCERPGPPTDWKLTLDDRAAVAREAERVASWSFERIVLAHGPLIDRDARDVWRDAFAFAQGRSA